MSQRSPRARLVRTILAGLTLAVALVGPTFGGALETAAAAPGDQAQEETGTIEAPLRFALDATYSSWPGGQRQVYSIAGSNGLVGYTIELSDLVAGGRFELDVTGGVTGLEDLDLAFYASFDPVVSSTAYNTRGAGGEAGTIPADARYAVITMFNGAHAAFRFRGYEPVATTAEPAGKPAPLPLPASPGIYGDYGVTGKGVDAWSKELRKRSHVVIAVVDTGINPYHTAYRRPDYRIHPSKYIEGFPAAVPALGLSLGAPDYVSARNADDAEVWAKVGGKTLYWIPGTNIVGAYSDYDVFDETLDAPPAEVEAPRPIIDDSGHGTGTTSVAAGGGTSSLGAPFGSNPNALIVSLEGLGDGAVKWASEQPWIDFISGSYGDPISVPCNETVNDDGMVWCGKEYAYTAPFVLRDSRTSCFSAGNGLSRTGVAADRYSSLRPTSGPSWVVTVGAVSPRNGQDYGWHSVPVDVSSYGNHWPAADPFSLTAEQPFSGTSNATPVTCGVFSRALQAARSRLGDVREGIHRTFEGETVAAFGPARRGATGPLADGKLTRLELQDAVFKTAFPEAFDAVTWTYDPVVVPDNPAYYTQEGYGVANVESAGRAIQVLLGLAPLPDRADVDGWMATVDTARDAVYPPPTYP